ncbi:MAG TPA: cupredoxin domain-containing protein [Vicinamibacterales bacterium]|jgi:plastocyanin|nr:cupredoxin domain-containing protein [Vicinamibacterales bacterium]
MNMPHLPKLVRRMTDAGGKTRAMLVFAAFSVVAGAALIPVIANPRSAAREIVLETRNMTFYLEGSDVPNPTLVVKRGEEVRVIVRNQEPGITHAFEVASLAAAIEQIQPGSTASLSFRVPDTAGRHEYVCLPHARMMRGVLLVTE